MGRWLSALCVALLIGGAAAGTSIAAGTAHQEAVKTVAEQARGLRRGISWARGRTWHWQDVARVHRSRSIKGAGGYHSLGYLRWIEKRWNQRRVAAYKLAHRPRPTYSTYSGGIAHQSLWLCIHSREGAWNANTGNGYYGGLQMTAGWYGGPGHLASSDPPSVQMAAAEAQFRASGYSLSWLYGQWPNTAPPCT